MKKFDGKKTFEETNEGIIWDKMLYKKGTKEFDKLITELATDMCEQIDELIIIGSNPSYIYPKKRKRKDMEFVIGNFQSKYHHSLVGVKILRLFTLGTLKLNNKLLTIADVYSAIMNNNNPTLEEFYTLVIMPLIYGLRARALKNISP